MSNQLGDSFKFFGLFRMSELEIVSLRANLVTILKALTAATLPKYVLLAALVVTYLNTCPVLMLTYSFRRNTYFKAWFFN